MKMAAEQKDDCQRHRSTAGPVRQLGEDRTTGKVSIMMPRYGGMPCVLLMSAWAGWSSTAGITLVGGSIFSHTQGLRWLSNLLESRAYRGAAKSWPRFNNVPLNKLPDGSRLGLTDPL